MTNGSALSGVPRRVAYVDRGCAGAGEAVRVRRRGRLRHRQPIRCPTPLPGLAGRQRQHFRGCVSGSERSGRGCGALPTCSVSAGNRQPPESNVVHDHIRLRQHQIVAVACVGVLIGARHVQHRGRTKGGEIVGCSSGSSELSSGGCSAEMVSDRRSDANRQVLVKCVGENLLPTAQP